MAIVGFEFHKIDVNKNIKSKGGKLQISNNVSIKNVERMDLNLGNTAQPGLKFFFEYESNYEPDFAKVSLEGSVLFLADEQKITELLAAWDKDKKVPKEVMEPVMNQILQKSNIQSIILCNSVNLPPPVPMPKVKAK